MGAKICFWCLTLISLGEVTPLQCESPLHIQLATSVTGPHLMLVQIFPTVSSEDETLVPPSVLASLSSALSRFVCKYQLFVYCYTNFAFPFRSLYYILLPIHHTLPHTNPSVLPITFSTLVMQSPETFTFHRCSFYYLCLWTTIQATQHSSNEII